MKPVIEILLKPEDFVGNEFAWFECPMDRALARHFGVPVRDVNTLVTSTTVGYRQFKVLNDGFTKKDYDEVKSEYALGPKRKWDHYVEIQEV